MSLELALMLGAGLLAGVGDAWVFSAGVLALLLTAFVVSVARHFGRRDA